MKILVTRTIPRIGLDMLSRIGELDIWEEEGPIPRDELLKRIRDADALLSLLSDRIDGEVMDAASDLKVIGNYAVGCDNIDIREATSRRIPVVNTPGVLTDATADLAMALLLASARRIAEGDRYVRSGSFKIWGPKLMLGKDLGGSVLGVVGAGKIGEAVMRRAKCFGMDLAYHSRSRRADLEDELGIRYMELDELLRASDFVSLNCPLTPETHHLIGERELSIMKRDAILINTARGPVVDEQALCNALKSGTIGGAGLDVFEREPEIYAPLMDLENVTMVPHVGSATIRTRNRMAELVAGGITDCLGGRKPENLVNPEVIQERGV
ncbi:MAG: 2-hydroxyacid dehydrogenase [Thermoplasmatota archaeon]